MGAGSECAQYNLSTTNPLNIFPDSPPYNQRCILRAVFNHSLVPQQTLTVINQYLYGYVYPNCGSGCQEDKDSIINLAAYPDGDQFFSHWTGTNNNAVNPTTVTMSSDRNVEAIYVPIVHLSSFVGGGGGGSVSGAGKYGQGDTAILTATPATNYSFSHWSGNASGSQNPLSVVMTGDKSITANFSYHTPSYAPTNYPSIFNNSEAKKPTLASTSDMMASVGALVLGLWPLLAILLGLGIAFYILYEILDIGKLEE
jgi:hypothetical protein